MKICMVAPIPPPYGGISNWVALMDEHVKTVSDVEFIHINTAPKKRSTEGRTLWDRVVVQGLSMFKVKANLKKAIAAKEPDIIHMTTSGQLSVIRDILLLRFAKKKNIPTVYHIRFGRIPQISESNTKEWKLIKKAMSLATQVIAIDTSTLNAIRTAAPSVNVCYVPNPFDAKQLDRLKKQDNDSRKKEIIFLGWVIKTKGIEELLAAWEKLYSLYPHWKLRIIGPYLEEYLKGLEQNFSTDAVIFDGEKKHEDALRILNEGEIFILPSYTEGFPNAVLEAMALSKPIIATSVGAIPDMLSGCGIVIPPKDADAIAFALRDLLNDENKRQELGIKAQQKLEEEYLITKIFNVYQNIWKSLSRNNNKKENKS